MSESKHTPGPFGVHIGLDYARVLASPDTHTDDAVAEVYGEDEDQRAANAYLLHAAPDLLGALKQAVSTLGAVDPVYDLEGQEADEAQAAWDKDMARYSAAVAKAEATS